MPWMLPTDLVRHTPGRIPLSFACFIAEHATL